MAKKKEKTLEEKLQEALVPENQWPYILPENWCWLQISKLYDVGSSKRIHKSDWIDKGIPFIRTRELVKLSETGYVDNDLFISELLYEELKAKYGVPKYGDILISGVGTIGVPYIVKGKKQFYFKDGNVIWLKPKVKINASYIFWLYKSQFVINQIKAMSSGTTVDTYTITNANNTLLPIPPLLEQKRIVHRIESLFAKLDEAKEKIQQVLDGAEMRKAAILHKAFTGELTKNWRKENTAIFGNSSLGIDEELISDNLKKLPDNWCWCKIGDFLELKAGKNIKAENISIEKNDNNKYACYGGNGIRGYVDSFNVEGTHIIIGRQGALCGNINIAENKFYATEHAVVVYPRYDTDISWLSENLRFLNLNQYSRSAAQPGLAVKNINNVLMPVAPYAEQVEMGRLISQMLNVWKQKEIICNKVLNKIDTMKKSILAKAFRGELGTNNPNEDSAINLLKEVLQDKF